MILSIYFKKLRNSEFIQFFTDLFSILAKFNTKEMLIQDQIEPIKPDLETVRTINATATGSDISDELDEIDNRRDKCINGIKTVVEGYTNHYDAKIREAAQLLLNKIETFGPGIAKQNYPTETTSLKGIVDAFKNEEKLKLALAFLGLTPWAEKMEEENNLFNTRYLARVDEVSKETNDKIIVLRKSINEKYYTLREHIKSHATLKTNDQYPALIDQLNALIDKYNGIVKRRSGKNKGNGGDTTPDAPAK
jgi:hypothetical protein